MDKTQLEELAAFIREHRSSEGNFEILANKLDDVAGNGDQDLAASLSEIKDKWIPPYLKAKESGGTAWPEYEKFVSEFEKTITGAIREENQ